MAKTNDSSETVQSKPTSQFAIYDVVYLVRNEGAIGKPWPFQWYVRATSRTDALENFRGAMQHRKLDFVTPQKCRKTDSSYAYNHVGGDCGYCGEKNCLEEIVDRERGRGWPTCGSCGGC